VFKLAMLQNKCNSLPLFTHTFIGLTVILQVNLFAAVLIS